MKDSLKTRIKEVQDILLESPIFGCITGSSLLEADFDSWREAPDVDVFCYSDSAFVSALTWLKYECHAGMGAVDATANEMAWAEKQVKEYTTKGINWKNNHKWVDTVKLNMNNVTVNVSRKKNQDNAADVINAFDMSIIMKAIDIQTGVELDERTLFTDDTNKAVVNRIRIMGDLSMGSIWSIDHWLRQWDRVVKYWERGFDTRPTARTYLEWTEEAIATGLEMKSKDDATNEIIQSTVDDLIMMKEKISNWLKEKGN